MFILVWKDKIIYWLGFWKRYKGYQASLQAINIILNMKEEDANSVRNILSLMLSNIDCGYKCDYNHYEPFEFVPKDGCFIHD